MKEDFQLYALLSKLFKDRGVDFRQYRPKCIKRRIAARMRAVGVKTYQEYIKVFDNFYRSLVPGGYLVLGKVESVWGDMQKYFTAVDHKNRVYQKVS